MDLINKFLALQKSLVRLGFEEENLDQEVDAKINIIIKSCCQLLNVSRVSLWLFTEDQKSIVCNNLYIAKENKFEKGLKIDEYMHPNYFKAVRTNRVINADDAFIDERTSEFTEGYLKPFNIMSMLDVPVFKEGGLAGLICIEQEGNKRTWDMAEISYSVSVADSISLIYAQASWLLEKEKLSFMERMDPLTGLENRLFFQKRINQAAKRSIKNKICAVFLVGMDGFTHINDRYGYHFANRVLCEVAHRLDNIKVDINYTLSRISGDVFALWVPEVDDLKVVDALVEEIQYTLQEAIRTPSNEVVSLSCCIGVFQEHIKQLVDVDAIRKAELAMQKAKEKSYGAVCFYKPEWFKQYQEQTALDLEFIEALNSHQIIPYYQPIVQYDYEVKGVSLEALVRWEHPRKGILSPDVILPIAKRLCLMEELGEVVLEQVCKDTRTFLDQGVNLNKISINLSSEQLFSPSLIKQVNRYIKESKISVSFLEFEIVEELISGDFQILAMQFEEFSKIGIELSIDDFGTGYSSLSRLKNLPVSKLKIDKSFVDLLPNNENDICIIKSIIGLAEGMNLRLVAEGVETKEQASWLLENGCDYLQGYLISRPVNVNGILEFVKQGNLLKTASSVY